MIFRTCSAHIWFFKAYEKSWNSGSKREIGCDKILGIFQLQFSKKKARQTYTTMSQLAFLVFVKITCHFYGGGKLKKNRCVRFYTVGCFNLWKRLSVVVHKSHPTMNQVFKWVAQLKNTVDVVLFRTLKSPSLFL